MLIKVGTHSSNFKTRDGEGDQLFKWMVHRKIRFDKLVCGANLKVNYIKLQVNKQTKKKISLGLEQCVSPQVYDAVFSLN